MRNHNALKTVVLAAALAALVAPYADANQSHNAGSICIASIPAPRMTRSERAAFGGTVTVPATQPKSHPKSDLGVTMARGYVFVGGFSRKYVADMLGKVPSGVKNLTAHIANECSVVVVLTK